MLAQMKDSEVILKLSDVALKLKQDASSITTNPLLNAIDIKFLKKIESMSQHDEELKKIHDEMNTIMQTLRIEDIEKQKELHTKYGEAKFYVYFKGKSGITTKVIPRKKGIKTPDFKINSDGHTFYGEVKSLLMAGGNLNYDRALNDGLQSRIDAEDEIRKGKHVGCGIQIIQPHLRNVTNYDPFSVRIVIDNLIAKFNQNFKEEQYSHGDTLSLIYLNDHNFPLYGLGTIKQKMLPIYFDDARNSPVSGELWWAAFAHLGNYIFKPPEFEGASGIDGVLEKQGILVEHPQSKAVIYYIDPLSREEEIVGLYRAESEDHIHDLVFKLVTHYNDDLNTQTYLLMDS